MDARAKRPCNPCVAAMPLAIHLRSVWIPLRRQTKPAAEARVPAVNLTHPSSTRRSLRRALRGVRAILTGVRTPNPVARLLRPGPVPARLPKQPRRSCRICPKPDRASCGRTIYEGTRKPPAQSVRCKYSMLPYSLCDRPARYRFLFGTCP